MHCDDAISPCLSCTCLQAQPKVVGRMRVMVSDVAREGRIKDHWPLLEAQVSTPAGRWHGAAAACSASTMPTRPPLPPLLPLCTGLQSVKRAGHLCCRDPLLRADGRVPPVTGLEPCGAGKK